MPSRLQDVADIPACANAAPSASVRRAQPFARVFGGVSFGSARDAFERDWSGAPGPTPTPAKPQSQDIAALVSKW